ncbi:hypothetical protein GCM10020001_068030 [Nonomuraea salmonea]
MEGVEVLGVADEAPMEAGLWAVRFRGGCNHAYLGAWGYGVAAGQGRGHGEVRGAEAVRVVDGDHAFACYRA